MSNDTILGTTTVSPRWRISLIKSVRDEFELDGEVVEVGDRLVYREREGEVVLELA